MDIQDTFKIYYSNSYNNSIIKNLLIITIIFSLISSSIESVFFPKLFSSIVNDYNIKKFIFLSCILILLIFVYYFKGLINVRIANKLTTDSRIKFKKAILNKYKDNYKDIEIGKYITRIFSCTAELKSFIKYCINSLIPNTFILGTIAIYLFYLNYQIGLTLFINLIIVIIIIKTKGNNVRKNKIKVEEAFFTLFDRMNNKFMNLLNTYVNNSINLEKKDIQKIQNNYKNLEIEYGNNENQFRILLLSNTAVFSIIIIYIYTFKTEHLNLTLQSILIILYVTISLQVVKDLPSKLSSLAVAQGSNTFLSELMNTKKNINGKKFTNGEIKLINLSYSYASKNIFENLNLHIKDKEKVVIIGKSGSGKTTLMKLILRLHEFKGNIMINNINSRDVSLSYLRKHIIYINQQTILLNDTVLNNMKYGINIDDQIVIKLLKKYNLLSIFSNLKNGVYEVCLTSGSNLSLGMQKVILLIRGILKINKSYIVIFDEPLASLDKNTCESVLNMIKNECKDKTVIIITHDYQAKKISNRVINLNNL